MQGSNENDTNSENKDTPADFHGAAVIDKNGQEVPITEEMVQKACSKLEDAKKEKDTD